MKTVLRKTTITAFKIIRIKLAVVVFVMLPFVVFTLLTSQTSVFAGMKSYVVVSGSMEPSIPVGSIIYTKSEDFYSPNDVIAFQKEGATITHRIVGMEAVGNELYYTTKGDANNAEDEDLVVRQDVVGKTLFFVPYLGKIIMSLKTPFGFVAGIVLPSLAFVLFELWNVKKEIERSTEKKVMERLGAL